MGVEVRIKSALKGSGYKASEDGDQIVEVDIPASGLEMEEVRENELVEDAMRKDDGDIHLWVSAEPEKRVYSV